LVVGVARRSRAFFAFCVRSKRLRGGILGPVLSVQRLRKRLPLVVFILLALVCLVLVGFACACLSDHPVQAIERALLAVASLPGLSPAWSWFAASVALGLALWPRRVVAVRPTPQLLQRFLT